MSEIVSNVPIAKPSALKWSPTEILLVGAISVFAVWFMQYLWQRKRIYTMTKDLKGPIALPFVGSSYYFIGSPFEIFANLTWLFDNYPSYSKFWHGSRLIMLITDPDDIESILTSPKCLAKEELYKYGRVALGNGLLTAPMSVWKAHRKAILPTFNQKILDNFVPIFVQQSKVLNEQLEKEVGKEIDLFHYITKCTLDIICQTAMGISINAQTGDNIFGSHVDRFLKITFLRMFFLFYQSDFIFNLTGHKKKLDESVKYIKDLMRKVIQEKRAEFEMKKKRKNSLVVETEDTKTKKAFLDYLMEITDQGEKFTDEELQDEVASFLVAGTDTTGTTNCFMFIMLGMHPDVQQKVYEEIIDVLGPDRDVEPTDFHKLNYMELVIKETLRLYPVGPFVARYTMEDVQMKNGHILPKGTSSLIGIFHTQKNPKYWKDPLIFDPNRFLPEETSKRHPYQYLPFSAGPRNCVGPRYAMMAMKSLFCTVLRKYRISTEYKSVEEVELKTNILLRPKNGYKVKFHLRNP